MSYIKSPKEIERLRETGKRMGVVLDRLAACVHPGQTAAILNREADRLIREAGGTPAFLGYTSHRSDPPFPGVICFSKNNEVVHGIPTKEKICEEGDIVTIDIGMWMSGVVVDTAMTVAVGAIPKKTAALVSATAEALEEGIRACIVGNTIADIGKRIQAFLEPKGYGIVRALVGHGTGHELHEEPRVPNFYDKRLESYVLEPGVVIAIEPMVTMGSYEVDIAPDGWGILTKDGSLSAHAEHTIAITEDGPLVVTRRPSESGV